MENQTNTLESVIDAYLSRYKLSSRRTAARDLIPMRDWLGPRRPLEAVSGFDLLRYAGAEINSKPYSINTRRMKLKAIRIFFNWCVKNHLLTENPSDMLDIPAEQRADTRAGAFTADESRRMIEYAAGLTTLRGAHQRDLALFTFCHDTGVRVGSLAAMQRRDVDLAGATAKIYNTKRQRHYLVRFGAYARDALETWIGELPADAYLWSTRPRGAHMTTESISQIPARACKVLKIPVRSIHAWRHGVGHRMADNGFSANYVARALDNSEEVAQRYYMPRDVEGALSAVLSVSYRPEVEDTKIIRLDKKTS